MHLNFCGNTIVVTLNAYWARTYTEVGHCGTPAARSCGTHSLAPMGFNMPKSVG